MQIMGNVKNNLVGKGEESGGNGEGDDDASDNAAKKRGGTGSGADGDRDEEGVRPPRKRGSGGMSIPSPSPSPGNGLASPSPQDPRSHRLDDNDNDKSEASSPLVSKKVLVRKTNRRDERGGAGGAPRNERALVGTILMMKEVVEHVHESGTGILNHVRRKGSPKPKPSPPPPLQPISSGGSTPLLPTDRGGEDEGSGRFKFQSLELDSSDDLMVKGQGADLDDEFFARSAQIKRNVTLSRSPKVPKSPLMRGGGSGTGTTVNTPLPGTTTSTTPLPTAFSTSSALGL
eukprot:CAMPEP_0175065512 /NCGR_PEP_ID=MMETSP0052_2-20121109/15969_1 /TAXON_ID=51329 ORGANISM="Polytomella parva, Strain SAG 63-3" /NCGR_SAMPLE_ID=MMETSP0052_2 /ASSEMBLY_ACC=CAM_ASM_000194 /LENGTH=287 /DNA_ID=CAMNT_0016332061 /DNA_START=45 /DNA_END=905 /DNA_ORIENTATION=-